MVRMSDAPRPLAALTEPICKLLDSVRACVGTLYEPMQIRKRAEAEADAMLIMARADAKRQELASRAAHRLALQELRRQENIEAIVSEAAKTMPDSVNQEPVEPD